MRLRLRSEQRGNDTPVLPYSEANSASKFTILSDIPTLSIVLRLFESLEKFISNSELVDSPLYETKEKEIHTSSLFFFLFSSSSMQRRIPLSITVSGNGKAFRRYSSDRVKWLIAIERIFDQIKGIHSAVVPSLKRWQEKFSRRISMRMMSMISWRLKIWIN